MSKLEELQPSAGAECARGAGKDNTGSERNSTASLALTTLPVLLALTGLWTAWWLGMELFFVSRGGTLEVSMKIAAFSAVAVAFVAATPALLYRQVKNRGKIAAAAVGAGAALIAAALGEITIATMKLWMALGVVSPRFGMYAATQAILGGHGHLLLLRALALVSFVGFAFAFAKVPKRS